MCEFLAVTDVLTLDRPNLRSSKLETHFESATPAALAAQLASNAHDKLQGVSQSSGVLLAQFPPDLQELGTDTKQHICVRVCMQMVDIQNGSDPFESPFEAPANGSLTKRCIHVGKSISTCLPVLEETLIVLMTFQYRITSYSIPAQIWKCATSHQFSEDSRATLSCAWAEEHKLHPHN